MSADKSVSAKSGPPGRPETSYSFKPPTGGINLMARYAQYEPGVDARERRNVGKRGAPIHGKILGVVVLPGKDKTKPWQALAVKLVQPCPVKDMGTGDEKTVRIAQPGETIVVTLTAAIGSIMARGFDELVTDPAFVPEVFIEPEVSKTEAGQSLWVFPTFTFLDRHPRGPNEHVGIRSLFPQGVAAPELTEGNGLPAV